MTKKLARLLRADIQETSDLKSIAKMLANKGRGGDTILAHITPKEIRLLKEAGGAGTVNPETGLLEFYDGEGYGDYEPVQSAMNVASQQWQPPAEAPAVQEAPVEAPAAVAMSSNAAPDDFSYTNFTGDAARNFGMTPVESMYAEYPGQLNYQNYSEVPLSKVLQQQDFLNRLPPDAAAAAMSSAATSPEAVDAQAKQAAAAGGKTPPTLVTRAGDVLSAIKAGGGDVLDYLKKNPDLLRIGGAGTAAVLGRQQAQKAAQQVQQATQEQKNVGQPYQQAGTELQRAAMSGELTPQGAQAYQAMRAQMAQGVESRGGVGVAQAQAQTEAFRQQLLQNQYNLGLQVAQIGDNIALGAIRTGMQLDQQLAQANQQFYTQLAAIAGGGTYGYAPQQTRGTP